MKTVHFVRFYFPGSFVSETSEREIESRDAPVDMPPRAYGYAFFDKTLAMNGKEMLWGPERNTSGITYRGEVYDLERVKREMPSERILISNMECNGYKRVVVTQRGTFPLNDDDKVVSD
jgi:hypothetical protein